MTDEAPRSVQVNLRLSPVLKQAAERAAADDHRSLTSLIEKLLFEHVRGQPTLEDWHERAKARLASVLEERKFSDSYRLGSHTFSYLFRSSDPKQVQPQQLTSMLRNIYQTLGHLLGTPNIFYPYTRAELLPYFTSDAKLARGRTSEILEFIGLPDVLSWPEFWRVSPAGLVTSSQPLFEDREEFRRYQLEPGKWFSPFFMTRSLAEIVLHAQIFSEQFGSPEIVEFRCEWSGLREREISDADPLTKFTWQKGHIARDNERVTVGEWPVADLRMQWPEVVSALGAPVMRLFHAGFDYSPEWVRSQIQRFKR